MPAPRDTVRVEGSAEASLASLHLYSDDSGYEDALRERLRRDFGDALVGALSTVGPCVMSGIVERSADMPNMLVRRYTMEAFLTPIHAAVERAVRA